MTAPDWLTRRGGTLKLGTDGQTWFVVVNGRPEYSVVATPIAGQFGSTIRQTCNGMRIANAETYPTSEEAIRGGLEALRKALGWE